MLGNKYIVIVVNVFITLRFMHVFMYVYIYVCGHKDSPTLSVNFHQNTFLILCYTDRRGPLSEDI